MRNQILSLFLFLAAALGHSQTHQMGEAFDFDDKIEKEPQFVLADNYNYYLMTIANKGGFSAMGEAVMRKFDQNDKLMDTYRYEFPRLDKGALYNCLGYSEMNGKLTVFTQCYWGKGKKNALYKHEFDKSTNTFKTTEIYSNAIESNGKSGAAYVKKSDNGRFIGVGYIADRVKGQSEKVMILMLDATTLNVAWQKEFSFEDENYTKEYAVTNSGKVVFHRFAKGWKKHNYLVLGSADSQEDKNFENEIYLQDIRAISIGSQDYILAFNYPIKTVRGGGDFANLLLYDLQSGRTIKNDDVNAFGPVKDLRDVQITNVAVQGNEIHVFAEAKTETIVKTMNSGMGGGFPEAVYKFGPSSLIVMGTDGSVKAVKNLDADDDAKADFYHSFGLIDIKGTHWVNGGIYKGFYPLSSGTYDKNPNGNVRFYSFDPLKNDYDYKVPPYVKYVNTAMHYFPDTNKMIFARTVGAPQQQQTMNIVSVKM